MIIEDIKEPCEECVHKERCTIKHPELVNKEETLTIDYCEKLDKYSRHVSNRTI